MTAPSATAGRTRTVTWEDPLESVRAGLALSGMEYFQEIIAGRIPPPPVAALLGLQPEEAEPGRVVFSLEPGEHLFNPIGMVHGGMIAALLDTAMGCAVHATLPAGVSYSTLEFKVNFVRAVGAHSGKLSCEGSVVHAGRTVATAEGRVTDQAGRLCAHATTTILLLGSTRREGSA